MHACTCNLMWAHAEQQSVPGLLDGPCGTTTKRFAEAREGEGPQARRKSQNVVVYITHFAFWSYFLFGYFS
jgi:hypothetical protein